jgi:hypothetical protein
VAGGRRAGERFKDRDYSAQAHLARCLITALPSHATLAVAFGLHRAVHGKNTVPCTKKTPVPGCVTANIADAAAGVRSNIFQTTRLSLAGEIKARVTGGNGQQPAGQ